MPQTFERRLRVLANVLTSFAILCAPLRPLQAQSDERIGSFLITRTLDPMDDSNRSMAFTTATNGQGSRIAALAWRCLGDGLNVVYLIGKYFGGDSDNEVLVRTRIDSDPPSQAQYWSLSQEHKAAFMPMRAVTAFTERAKHGRRLILRVTDPLDGETHTDEFEIVGLSSALERIGRCEVRR